jgi:hypothetical protein
VGRKQDHAAELRKLATESEGKLKRLYDAIESGVADVKDRLLKDRIAELTAMRDQARTDAERIEASATRQGPAPTPAAPATFAKAACNRMRQGNRGYRRDHLRALAQRVEVDETEVRIIGSKSRLPRTPTAANGGEPAASGVPGFVPNWRTATGDDENYVYAVAL